MTKRIPQLDNTPSLGPDDLFEVAQANPLSPTGYVSRHVRYGDLNTGGTAFLPFRFPFEGEVNFSSPDYTEFIIEFDYMDLLPTSILQNENEYCRTIATASLGIRMSAFITISGDYGPETVNTSMDASVWYNNIDGGYANNIIVPQASSSTQKFPGAYWTNYFSNTPMIHPTNTYVTNDGTDMGKIQVEFRIQRPYNSYIRPTGVKFRGYADITSAFYRTPAAQ